MVDFSIVIPLFNKEKYLNDCVNSALNQQDVSLEIIIINDGSEDSSLEKAEKLAENDPRITLISIENQGVSAARNLGINMSKGKWIIFLDADDLLTQNSLAEAKKYLSKYNLDILISDFIKVDENNEFLENISISYSGFADNDLLLKLVSKYQFVNGYFGFVTNKVIKTSVITDNKIYFDERISLAEDLEFYSRLYKYCLNNYFITLELFRYRQLTTNYANRLSVDYLEQLYIFSVFKTLFKDSSNAEFVDIISKKEAAYITYYLRDAFVHNKTVKGCFKSLERYGFDDHPIAKDLSLVQKIQLIIYKYGNENILDAYYRLYFVLRKIVKKYMLQRGESCVH